MGSHKASKDMAEVTDSIGLDWDEIYFYIICFFWWMLTSCWGDVNVNELRMRAWHCADVSCKLRPIALRVSKKNASTFLWRDNPYLDIPSLQTTKLYTKLLLYWRHNLNTSCWGSFQSCFLHSASGGSIMAARKMLFWWEVILSNEDQIIFRSIEMAIKI